MRPHGIRRLFRFPTRAARDIRDDVDDELTFHLDMRIRDLMADGFSAERARARAMQELGDLSTSARSLARQGARDERRRSLTRLARDVRQDVSYGLRWLTRQKGFSLAAILTLAVAIGGNTTIFSVVNALFLQPLAIRAPEELVRIYTGESTVSWANLEDIRRRNSVFTDVIAQANADMALTMDPLPLRISAGLVSTNYFTVLGAAPLAGHAIFPEQRADVVVLSERLWRSRFGGSSAIVGQSITIDGRRLEVIAVMPRAFRGIAPAGFTRDVWVPVDVHGVHRGLASDRATARFEAFGRLKTGTTVAHALTGMRVLGAQLASEHPQVNGRFTSIEVFSASGIGLYRGVGKTLLPVFVFVGFLTVVGAFVLLISCANLAGLLLGRAAARRQEIAVRLALGAGPGRLMRQLLTESLLLAFIGGGCGLALAASLNSLVSRAAVNLPMPVDPNLALDLRVLGYGVAASLACALLFGLAPARRASRAQLVDSLKIDGAGGSSRQRFRNALVVVQVAFSALLLFWTGLFARSLLQVNTVHTGFDANGVLLAAVQLADDTPGSLERAESAFVELHDRVREFPSVESVGWSTIVPLALRGNERFRVSKPDTPPGVPGVWIVASQLSPGWFATVRIPFVAGRDFTWADREGSPPVVIVNETLARLMWSGVALGQQLKYWSKTAEVVGVVRDSKYWTLGETIAPTVYLPFRQSFASHAPTLHVRTSDPRGTAERIRREVQALLPGVAPELRPMREAVSAAVVPARIGAMVTGAFGLLGALLATLGVYGLISFIVVQRSREMAIRRAVGASASHIVRVVVGRTASLATIGLLLGVGAGALTAPVLGGLLVNVSPRDPLTALATMAVVLAATIIASASPALRAARIDPLAALRSQ